MFTIGYYPGKQTAKSSKPKSTGSGSSGGGGGSNSPTPYNTSPALRQDIRAEREAANTARGVTSRSSGASGGASGTDLTPGTATIKADLAAAPETPNGASGSAPRSAVQTTGQQIVQSMKAPASQFRSSAPSALVSTSYYNKAGDYVTEYYGTAEEQQAFRDQQKRQVRESVLQSMQKKEAGIWRSDLRRQQSISRQLRSGLVRPEKVPEFKAQLRRPSKAAIASPGLVTANLAGGRPIKNLGYTISYAPPSADQLQKQAHPIKYHAKKYGSGIIKGVGAGILGYAASQTTIVGGAGVAAGATVSAVPAAVVAGSVALGAGVYYGAKETSAKYRTYQQGGLGAVWGREKQRAQNWKATANKYSGEIVEGVAALTFAVPTYVSAQAYYSATTPVITGTDKGRITRTGAQFEPTSRQTTKRSFDVGGRKYVVKASTTAKEKIIPSIRSEAQEKTTYSVYSVGDKGKLRLIKTVQGSGEVQLKPDGEFIRFQKVGSQKTSMSVGQMTRGGRESTPRFVFETTGGRIQGYDYVREYTTLGYVERTESSIVPSPGKPKIPAPINIKEVWKADQITKPITKVTTGQKISRAVARGIVNRGGGNVFFVDAQPRAGGSLIRPDTEITPVFGTLGTGSAARPLTFTGFSSALGSGQALVSALVPSVGAGSLLTGGIVGVGVGYQSIEKTAAANVVKAGSIGLSGGLSKISTDFMAVSRPITTAEPAAGSQPLVESVAGAETVSNVRIGGQVINYISAPVFRPPFEIVPPDVPPGVPVPSLPPAGGVDSWARSFLKKSKQAKGYTPSATALAFGIKGKPSKAGAKSGLGLRPIVMPKKKKKLGFKF